jgi:Domain of unknown function (DUF4194)
MTQKLLTPSAPAKVRLLQDAIYSEDEDLWQLVQRYRQHLQDYFRELGLDLVIHDEDGFAYLHQLPPEEMAGLPRLARRDKLTKGVAIIGVLLREQLLHFDQTIHDEPRLIINRSDLAVLAGPFFPTTTDEVRSDRRIDTAITKAEEFGLLRKLPGAEGDERYEVRRIVKARFPLETLKQLRDQLASSERDEGEPS